MIAEDEVYKIGRITHTHGVKGEVAMTFTDDVWDRTDAEYLILRIDGILVPFFMEEYRFRSDSTALVKFQDYDSANDACELCGAEVYFPFALTPEDREDEDCAWRYFTGFCVVAEGYGELGTIDYVDESTQNVLFHVGNHLIPAVEEFIKDIDHQHRIITLTLPEGLLELN